MSFDQRCKCIEFGRSGQNIFVIWIKCEHIAIEPFFQRPQHGHQSWAISKDMKKRGFRFVGPTIVYAFMQACGLVNDHMITCHRHEAVKKLAR